MLSERVAITEVNPLYFHPTEVHILLGDATNAKEELCWQAEYSVEELVKDMVNSENNKIKSLESVL